MTTPAGDWTLIKAIVGAALDRAADARAAYVAEACGGDAVLMREVETILAAHADADTFLETPARFPAVPAALDLTGRTVGPYTIGARLGAGGMGEVYLARDAKLDR